ncbi:MAG: DUF885 family protein, partial [candidate division Zixibacteria bacterium]|nr:DUF885 family protein [candidate division Zixibacteria bacterium]
MLRTIKTFLILFLALAMLTAGESVAKKQTLDQVGAEIIETLQEFYPVTATEQGIHSYDHRLADYSSRSVKQMIKTLDGFERKLYKFKSAKLPQKDAINYRLLKSNVDIALLDLKQIKWHKKAPQLYANEATNGLYSLMLSQHAPMSEKVVSIVNRMKAVPGLFATARKNLKKPPPIYIEAANEALESAMEFYQSVAGDLMRQFPERADGILKVSTAAREAMNDFAAYLAEIEPGEEKSFAIGKENYNYKLSHEFFFDFDADSLLKIGETLLTDIQMKYRVQEENVEKNHQNGRDSVFVPAAFSKQDILDYYVWETDQIKIFLEANDFVTIPENIAPISVIETPAFLSTIIS